MPPTSDKTGAALASTLVSVAAAHCGHFLFRRNQKESLKKIENTLGRGKIDVRYSESKNSEKSEKLFKKQSIQIGHINHKK